MNPDGNSTGEQTWGCSSLYNPGTGAVAARRASNLGVGYLDPPITLRIYRNEKVVETHELNWQSPCFKDLRKPGHRDDRLRAKSVGTVVDNQGVTVVVFGLLCRRRGIARLLPRTDRSAKRANLWIRGRDVGADLFPLRNPVPGDGTGSCLESTVAVFQRLTTNIRRDGAEIQICSPTPLDYQVVRTGVFAPPL